MDITLIPLNSSQVDSAEDVLIRLEGLFNDADEDGSGGLGADELAVVMQQYLRFERTAVCLSTRSHGCLIQSSFGSLGSVMWTL